MWQCKVLQSARSPGSRVLHRALHTWCSHDAGREKRRHLRTTKLKPPDEAERVKGRCLQWATKAQKAPANNICAGWEQRSARLFWRAAAEEMECGFATRGLKLCLRRDYAARPRLGQLDGGIKQRLRATSVACVFTALPPLLFPLLFLFSWPNIQIWGGGWLKVYQPAPARSSAREKNVFMMLYL